jgi:hypothetical protein
MSTGVKHDEGKVQLDLLPREGLVAVARVLEHGARKYTRGNYKGGIAWRRCAGAALRHMFSWLDGETNDPESGLNHLAHAACGMMFLLEYTKTHPELDDRAKEVPPAAATGRVPAGSRALRIGERIVEGDCYWSRAEGRWVETLLTCPTEGLYCRKGVPGA